MWFQGKIRNPMRTFQLFAPVAFLQTVTSGHLGVDMLLSCLCFNHTDELMWKKMTDHKTLFLFFKKEEVTSFFVLS